jgi:hypothetical protein
MLVMTVLASTATGSLACDFPAIHSNEDVLGLFHGAQVASSSTEIEPARSQRAVVYQVANRLQVQHGHTCGRGYGGVFIHESAVIPRQFADTGTIIFNGSAAAYSDGGDHNVRSVASGAILNVENRGNAELHWDAAGALEDGDQRDQEWCYFYTLVFWRPSSVLRAGVPPSSGPRLNGEYDRPESAVHQILTSLTVTDDRLGGPRALLPRGNGQFFEEDHNLLQVGYEMKMPTIVGDTISWRSRTLLQDDSAWQPFFSAELVEVMNGASVNMWQPTQVWHQVGKGWAQEPVSFNLQGQSSLDTLCSVPVKTAIDQYVVDVPFSYAVPMLTGWRVGQRCRDSNVQQVGAYLDSFRFEPYPNGRSGRLSYTVVSTLFDDSEGRLVDRGNKVTILGLNPITQFPDLTSPLPPVLTQ